MDTFRKSVAIAAFITFGSLAGGANAALILHIDVNEENYFWSGSATSPSITIGSGEALFLNVGAQDSSTSILGGSSDSMNVSFSGTGGYSSTTSGAFLVDPLTGRLATQVASGVSAFSGGPAVGTFTATGNDQAYSYSSLSASRKSFMSGLDGADIYFQFIDVGVSSSNISNAGSVVVVPEPSSALLLGLGSLGILARRRRSA